METKKCKIEILANSGQGGRWEFEIGVAYNKVGQKYPNKDIGTEGQKLGWPKDQMARRPHGRITR